MIRGFDAHHRDKGDVTGKAAIEAVFECEFREGCEIIFAYNERYGYEEQCVVIWRLPDGRVAMVEDSHCSCNGYEGGMSHAGYPTAKQLGMADWGWIDDKEARDYLLKFIGEWLRNSP